MIVRIVINGILKEFPQIKDEKNKNFRLKDSDWKEGKEIKTINLKELLGNS